MMRVIRRMVLLVVVCAWVAGCGIRSLRETDAVEPWKEGSVKVHVLNVGTGLCTVLEPPSERCRPIVFDCGAFVPSVGRKAVTPKKANKHLREIDRRHGSQGVHVVLSHAHLDHYSWLEWFTRRVKVITLVAGQSNLESKPILDVALARWRKENVVERRIWAWNSDKTMRTPAEVAADIDAAEKALACEVSPDFKVAILAVNNARTFEKGGTRQPPTYKGFNIQNARSVVVRATYKQFSAIFPGDAEGSTEIAAAERLGGPVTTTLLIGEHHGSDTYGSNRAEWASKVRPALTVFSAGLVNGHPTCASTSVYRELYGLNTPFSAAFLAHAKVQHPYKARPRDQCSEVALDVPIYSTRDSGTVIVTSDGITARLDVAGDAAWGLEPFALDSVYRAE